MTQKTGYPTAVAVAHTAYLYLTRNQAKLALTISPAQATALTNLILCLATFLVEWPKPTPNP